MQSLVLGTVTKLRTMHGHVSRPANVAALHEQHRRLRTLGMKDRKKQLEQQLSDPKMCLVQHLIDSQYCLTRQGLQSLQLAGQSDENILPEIDSVHRVLIEQIQFAMSPDKIVQCAQVVTEPSLPEKYPALRRLELGKLPRPPRPEKATRVLSTLATEVVRFMRSSHGETYVPIPGYCLVPYVVGSPRRMALVALFYWEHQRERNMHVHNSSTLDPVTALRNWIEDEHKLLELYEVVASAMDRSFGFGIRTRPLLFPRALHTMPRGAAMEGLRRQFLALISELRTIHRRAMMSSTRS